MLIQPLRLASEGRMSAALGLSKEEIRQLAAGAGGFYDPFRTQRGEKSRLIDCPVDPLKTVQRRIDKALLGHLRYPPHLHGGIRKRSPKTNAAVHLGQSCVVRIDVRSYFPSIRHQHIYEVWCTILGCSPDISRLLTQLTTWRGRLPQGASTSMSLANLALLPADEEILRLAAEHDLLYTRYVDDLVFSGSNPRPIIQPVIGILRRASFSVSRHKIEIMSRKNRQEVTGYAVNRGDRVTKGGNYRDRIRAAIFQLQDLREAPQLFETSLRSIRGRLEHLRTVNPEAASTLDKRLAAVLLDRPSPRHLPDRPVKKPRRGLSLSRWRRLHAG